ncbi:SAM-dependent methyltransferase [Embleya scabrispora]|uniref:SAM-dependent methyltransferase n=1 Tax=Embleya scabrispora TaxID=159449 RepID=A0A1T3NRY4_9ACTN|nr:class I SAM-dependent methyltransferase [Embleya scabrispora]OPC79371.1 SAM-dependent methyltransferase [Embleya scabrispora]
MPTIPSGHTPRSEPPIQPHRHRETAESFGVDAERYDRTRPRYPQALVDRIVAAAPGPDVLDVGCGTGIVGRRFRAAGCTVLGVDPDPRMADWAHGRGLDVEVATFEDWDPAGRTFDALVCGQAWHWVDPVAGAAKAARVLRPDGRLALFWNAACPEPELAASFAEIHHRLLPDSPAALPTPADIDRAYTTMCTHAADGLRAAGGFAEPEQWRLDWRHVYTRDEWLDQVPTIGVYTRLAPDVSAELLTALGTAIDAAGGNVPVDYATLTLTTTREPA